MTQAIVQSLEPVVLVGGGELRDQELTDARALGRTLVAADGGARHVVASGAAEALSAIIGDMDSLSQEVAGSVAPNRIHKIDEQDSTDFDKCLRNISAPLVLAVGFTGARLDHQLAVLNTLVRHPARRCIVIGAEDILFLCPPVFALDVAEGTPVSLFPMGAVEGWSEGLRYPIGGINFAPDGRVGTSNAATGAFTVNITAPKILMLLPRAELAQVVEAFMRSAATWPVP